MIDGILYDFMIMHEVMLMHNEPLHNYLMPKTSMHSSIEGIWS